MKMKKILKLNTAMILSVFMVKYGVLTSHANIDVSTVRETETEIELKIDADSNIEYVLLPNGNKVRSSTANFTLTSNGTYTFTGYTNEGDIIEKSVSVNNLRANYLITPTPNVKLNLSSSDSLSGVESMRFKNESNGTWSNFEAYKTEKLWTLSNVDGERSVYAQFRDVAGNSSDVVYDKIILDLIGPVSNLFKINNGALYTNNAEVTLSINATDNHSTVKSMLFSNNNSGFTEYPYATQKKWLIPNTEGLHTVYLKLKDGVGNIGSTSAPSINQASITLDKTPPTGTINILEAVPGSNGAYIVPSPDVTLSLQVFDALSGVKEVNIYEGSNKTTLTSIPANNVSKTIAWTLNTDTPSTYVTLEVIDKAGNIYRTDSFRVTILSLKVIDFYLDNVFNPTEFRNGFTRKSWYGSDETQSRPPGFPRQPMLTGGDIEFSIKYSLDTRSLRDVNPYDLEWKYIITVTKPGGSSTPLKFESNTFTATQQEKDTQLLKAKYTLPYGLEKNSIVSIEGIINADCYTKGGQIFKQSATFPIEGGRAQIGEITGDIREHIKFNEIK